MDNLTDREDGVEGSFSFARLDCRQKYRTAASFQEVNALTRQELLQAVARAAPVEWGAKCVGGDYTLLHTSPVTCLYLNNDAADGRAIIFMLDELEGMGSRPAL